MTEAASSLEGMRARLRELLGLLDDEHVDADSLRRAMQECAANFDALREASSLAGEDELEETLRLNTVVLSRVRTEIESLARGIRQARQARQHVESQGAADVTGTSCDISG